MKLWLLTEDYSDKKVMISLSGGINSAALLRYMASVYPAEHRPRQVFLFYAHLIEHSPGTLTFVRDQIAYARKHFNSVVWEASRGSVIEYFGREKIIPHPMLSPCSEHLKIIPMLAFYNKHKCDVDLVGYVREESSRISRQQKKNRGADKAYPIRHLSNEDCFDLVEQEIGWYPPIYKIRGPEGKRVFKHNNCLPCKNMNGKLDGRFASGQFVDVIQHYPEYGYRAMNLASKLNAYWGRDKGTADCEFCKWS